VIRLLTVACLCAASLQIAIWSGLVSGWTTPVGSSLGDAATKLERAAEPRSALTSPADLLNRDVAATGAAFRNLKEAWRQNSAAQNARAIADLSAAREETRTLRARHGEAEKKVSDALEKQVQERARAEALDRDLAAARQEIQTLKVDQTKVAQDGNLTAVREENRTTARADAAADDNSVLRPEVPQNENDRSALYNSNDPGPTSYAMATAVPGANTLAAVQQTGTPSGAETHDAHTIPVDAINHLDADEIGSLLRRGDALIASGDLAAARLVLRRAVDAGDARAAMMLAETYDPATLEKMGVHGVLPDLAVARGWYEKAKKFGAMEATQRLELLASKQH
jgi:hypothetical protein